MVNRMDDSTAQASVPVTMPGSRLKVLVYFLLAITVALTASTGFLLYERINEKIKSNDAFGAEGEQQALGQAGPQGPPGSKGEQGLRGIKGGPGNPGATGPKGDNGKKGDVGPKGQRGQSGLDGSKGKEGSAGAKGDPGALGPTGPQGPPGLKGEPGFKGMKGDTGNPGTTGLKGDKGEKGNVGQKGQGGQPGLDGQKGEKGSAAPQTDTCTVAYPPENCEDVRIKLLMNGQPAISDQYVVVTPSGQQITVFCDFYHRLEVSYTYLSPAAINVIDTTTLRKLHNRRLSNVNVRLLMAGGGQEENVLEQLSFFQNKYPLVVQISEAVGYWEPVNYGASSFLYLGFQPAQAAPASTIDKSTNPIFGYRAGGVDFEFINRNQLAKSYAALFTNSTAFKGTSNYEWYNAIYPLGSWELGSQVVPVERYLQEDYFMEYEFRMGGCGGYGTSFKGLEMGIIGAQLGLPLDYRPNCLTEPIIP